MQSADIPLSCAQVSPRGDDVLIIGVVSDIFDHHAILENDLGDVLAAPFSAKTTMRICRQVTAMPVSHILDN
jgi:hypothetical protein